MTIIYLGIAWLIGIGFGAALDGPLWLWLAVGVGGVLLAIIFRNQAEVRLWLLILGVLALGAVRYGIAETQIDENHVAYYNGIEEIILTGVVIDEPAVSDRWLQLQLRADDLETRETSPQPVEGLVQMRTGRFASIPYGARLQVEGELENPVNTPEFNQRDYLARQDIYSLMTAPQITILAEGEGSPIKQAIFAVKDRGRETIRRLLPDPQAALLTGILLGDDSDLPPKLEEQFRTTGLTHIIAISGFNIAILTGVLLALSRPFLGHRWSAWFVLFGIALYTVLVGADAAVVRAAIMGALFVIAARLMGRPTFAPAGLFTAAIIMTAINPNILWDIGFQLSFAATLGLMLYVGPASDWTSARLRPKIGSENTQKLTRMLAEILFATLAAMLITLPIILYHFGQLSLISPLANLFVLPAQPGVMIWGGLATLTGMVVPAVGQLFAWVAWLFLTWTISLVRLFASVPGAAVPVSISPLGIVIIYALLFGATWYALKSPERREDIRGQIGEKMPQRLAIASLAILALLVVAWAFSQPDGYLHVSFLDVGQGDATLIQTPSGRQILVDGGAYPTVLNDQLGRQLPFWDRDIDLVIATHPDTDHVAGLPGVFERYRVGNLFTNGQTSDAGAYEALLTAAADNEVPVYDAYAGEVIAVDDGVRLEVLNPAADQLAADGHENEQSMALRLVYGEFSLLLTGDAGEAAERAMIEEGWDLTSLVYKAGHHGAKSSSSPEFLSAVQPQYVVISVGEGNRYGHPHEEVLQRVSDVGAAMLRTDELGTIEVSTDGEAMWWEVSSR